MEKIRLQKGPFNQQLKENFLTSTTFLNLPRPPEIKKAALWLP